MAERPAITIAKAFHEEYEHLAPLYGWRTQEASRVEWDDLPQNQRSLMVHVIGTLIASGTIYVPARLRQTASADPTAQSGDTTARASR